MNHLPALPSAGTDFAHRRTRLHDHAVSDLGIAIVSGRLPEGVPLPEAEIGRMLGVSRSVVREATKVLAAKGLLRSRPRVGTVPSPRDSWDVLDPEVLGWMLEHGPIADLIRDVSEVRLIIEPAAARLAALRRSDEEAERLRALADDLVRWGEDTERYVVADLDFHAAILSATKNVTLVRLTGAIGAALRASRRLTVHAPGGPQSAMAEHEAVAAAIIDGDPDRADARMRDLIVLTQSHIECVLTGSEPTLPNRSADPVAVGRTCSASVESARGAIGHSGEASRMCAPPTGSPKVAEAATPFTWPPEEAWFRGVLAGDDQAADEVSQAVPRTWSSGTSPPLA